MMNPYRLNRYKRQLQEVATVSNLFLAIQVIVFILMTLLGGSQNGTILILFGAKFNPAIQIGQYWRLITPMFVHIGWEHILFNSIFLYFLGNQMERIIGHGRFFIIYLLSGILGNVASFAFSPSISAGASTALFGLFGMIVYLSRNHAYIRYFRELGMQYAALIIVNVVFGFLNGGVDNFGHIGGLVGGYLATAAISFRGDRKTTTIQRAAAVIAYLVAFAALFVLGMRR